jgi:hypothetical protein
MFGTNAVIKLYRLHFQFSLIEAWPYCTNSSSIGINHCIFIFLVGLQNKCNWYYLGKISPSCLLYDVDRVAVIVQFIGLLQKPYRYKTNLGHCLFSIGLISK